MNIAHLALQIIDEYINEGRSMNWLANKYNVTGHTIKKMLLLHGIKIRTQKEANYKVHAGNTLLVGKEDHIAAKYIGGISMSKIAKEYNVSRTVIKRILSSKNVKIRTAREVSRKQFTNYSSCSSGLMEQINGWLLGDGSLEGSNYQSCFKIPSKHEEYIKYISSCFHQEHIIHNIYKTFDYKSKKYYHRLTTCSTLQLRNLYDQWYPNGYKIVPKNIQLTKKSIINWIMDDGTRDHRRGSLTFCTHGFTYEECLLLANRLNNFIGNNGTKIHRDGRYYKLYLNKLNANTLLKKIGGCPVDCFAYKWFEK